MQPVTQYPVELAAADPVLFCATPKCSAGAAVAGRAASAVAETASAAVAGTSFDGRGRGKRQPCPLELFIAAGKLPFDPHRLPWNAVFVCTGACRCEGGLPSVNHKLGFHVVGSSRYGELCGPMVGARASAVAAVTLLDEAAWDIGATNVDGIRVPTICAVFDLTLAEEPARELLGDWPVRVAVLVTTSSSSSFGAALEIIVGFVVRMQPELVVLLHPHGTSTPPAVPHSARMMARCVNDGRTHNMDQLYAEPHLAVARMTGKNSRYRIGMHGQKQFENRPMVRNIKISHGDGKLQ